MRKATLRGNGFTLIEILIAIAIVVILAVILVPMLLNARSRAFDAGTQSCLKEVATRQEAIRTAAPFEYDATFDPTTVESCSNVNFLAVAVAPTFYTYDALHASGGQDYRVQTGTPVVPIP